MEKEGQNRQVRKQMDSYSYKQTDRQTETKYNKNRDRETNIQTDRQKIHNKQTWTDK